MLMREFDRQVENLLRKGYPGVAGLAEHEFLAHLEPLRERIGGLSAPALSPDDGRVPVVIVVTSGLLAVGQAMQFVEREGKRGFTTMDTEDLRRFGPIEGLELPGGPAYLLVDVDTGRDTLNVTPDEALKRTAAAGRSPLTLEEGIALVTHYPEALRKNGCFSLLGSRCGDRRVTALWLSGGRPKLGWCWAGNPHTWLGSASCGGRAGG